MELLGKYIILRCAGHDVAFNCAAEVPEVYLLNTYDSVQLDTLQRFAIFFSVWPERHTTATTAAWLGILTVICHSSSLRK